MHKKDIFGTFEHIKSVFGFMLLSVAWLVVFVCDCLYIQQAQLD